MALQVLKVTAVVLADIADAKRFGESIQNVLVQAARDCSFRDRTYPAVTILAGSNSVLPAPKDLAGRYEELERQANEAVSLSVER